MQLDVNGKPVWKDGDVVKIRFVRKRDANVNDGLMLSDVYEYRRQGGWWPGESGFWSEKYDDDMTAAWEEGRLAVMEMVEAPEPEKPFIERLRQFVYTTTTNRRADDPTFTEYEVLVITRDQRDQLFAQTDLTELGSISGQQDPPWRGMGLLTAPEDVVLTFPRTHLDCRNI